MYVLSDILLLADVFENFRNMCLEIYELDPARLLTALGLGWQRTLNKTKVRLDFLINIDMFLIIGKGIRSRICHSIH